MKIKLIYIILSFFFFSCNQESLTDYKLKAYKNEVDKFEEKLSEFKLNKVDKILLSPFSFSYVNSKNEKDRFFQLSNKNAIKELMLILRNNGIREYSLEKIFEGNHIIETGDLDFRPYYLNDNWKNDSICFVPDGFQYYIPMDKIKWNSFFNEFEEVYSRKYHVKYLEKTRNVFHYAANDNLIVKHQIEEDAVFSEQTDLWVKFDGCFQYEKKVEKEDVLGNQEKLRVKKKYPKYQFDIDNKWGVFIDDRNVEGMTIYCNEDFYSVFKGDHTKSGWINWKGYLEVFADKAELNQIDSIFHSK